MSVDELIQVVVTLTLIEMMLSLGLGVRADELLTAISHRGLTIRALLANYLVVPAATVALLLLFDPPPMVAVGFLILAVCPGAPYGPPFTALAKGNVPLAVAWMVLLAGSSAFLAPLLLRGLLPLVAGNAPLEVDALRILLTLLATQLVPLGTGIALRLWRPRLADRLEKPSAFLARILNLVVVGLILGTQFELLAELRLRAVLGMLALLTACWVAGALLAGADPGTRKGLMLTTSLRNVGVGLVIVTGSFPATGALTAVLVYGLFEVFGSLLLALWLSHR